MIIIRKYRYYFTLANIIFPIIRICVDMIGNDNFCFIGSQSITANSVLLQTCWESSELLRYWFCTMKMLYDYFGSF